MKILALDTSTKILALAVFENSALLKEENYDSGARHGEGIIDAVEKIMRQVKTNIKEIKGIILGAGPGSFTGLRIGFSLVKGFSLARSIPVLIIPTLDFIAYNGLNYAKNICVMVDARQEKVYGCLFSNNKHLKRVSPYLLCPADELIRRAKKVFKGEILFLGDGIKLYQDKIARDLKKVIFAEEPYWYPRGAALGYLGWSIFKKRSTKDLNKIEPLYLYPKECQISNRR